MHEFAGASGLNFLEKRWPDRKILRNWQACGIFPRRSRGPEFNRGSFVQGRFAGIGGEPQGRFTKPKPLGKTQRFGQIASFRTDPRNRDFSCCVS